LVEESLPEDARAKPLEVWFQDEARVGQQGTLTRLWAKKGSRPRAPRDLRYDWAYIFGAACPARGVGAALVMPHANGFAFAKHLEVISAAVAPGAHAVVIIDGAGYHAASKFKIPHNITLIRLTPYSPELNAAEHIWAWLRANKLANRVFKTWDDIVNACCQAWNDFVADPTVVTSVTTRGWAQVKL
jgi:transposase